MFVETKYCLSCAQILFFLDKNHQALTCQQVPEIYSVQLRVDLFAAYAYGKKGKDPFVCTAFRLCIILGVCDKSMAQQF